MWVVVFLMMLCVLQEKPDAAYIGVPPTFHGSFNKPEASMELQLAKASPPSGILNNWFRSVQPRKLVLSPTKQICLADLTPRGIWEIKNLVYTQTNTHL